MLIGVEGVETTENRLASTPAAGGPSNFSPPSNKFISSTVCHFNVTLLFGLVARLIRVPLRCKLDHLGLPLCCVVSGSAGETCRASDDDTLLVETDSDTLSMEISRGGSVPNCVSRDGTT